MANSAEPLIACWVFVLPDGSGKGGARAGSGAARLWRRTSLTPYAGPWVASSPALLQRVAWPPDSAQDRSRWRTVTKRKNVEPATPVIQRHTVGGSMTITTAEGG
jgi:hypothetical protein